MDLDAETKATLSPWMPDFSHVLVDLSKLDADDIKGNVYGKIALHLLKSGLKGKLGEAFTRLEPLLQTLSQQDNVMGLVEVLLRYSAQVAEDVSLDELRDFVVKNLSETAGEKLMTIAEQIKQEVAEEYQHQVEAALSEKEQALHDKEQALQREKVLLDQLREAGIEPKEPKH